ncbi:hypothetical protein [Guptibacillus hwajinpoensis]|uniref:Uncharacterized protein n=1 Tax=Guptibacillus hwajinpoensis TaxID=208199 RepID=A0ABU0K4L3_9BACL|nr:hypothetical protein [Alkalihalobacillus hemicentroti]MDQ0483323.1 hypothetical protein [Alkalihalobacillus hemicentroti]
MGNRRSAATPRTYLKNTQNEVESSGETSPSCSRFCSNVCRRLFPFNFDKCFNDCLSCKQDVIFETDDEFYEE